MLSCLDAMPEVTAEDDVAIPGGAHFAISAEDLVDMDDLPHNQRKLLEGIAEHYALHESIQGAQEQAAITASGDFE